MAQLYLAQIVTPDLLLLPPAFSTRRGFLIGVHRRPSVANNPY